MASQFVPSQFVPAGPTPPGSLNLHDLQVTDAAVFREKIEVPTPSTNEEAANKAYVDNVVGGTHWKDPCRAATILNIASLSGIQTIDGVLMADGDRILVKDQADPIENGYYNVSTTAWTRTTDMPVGTPVSGFACTVEEGTVNGDKVFICTNNGGSDIVGTDSLMFSELGGGISAINTLSPASQFLVTGTTGTDFAISSVGDTHTFNLPTASATNTGKLSNTDWTTFNDKLTSTLTDTNIFVGNGSNVATGVAMSGDATLANTGALTLANTAVTPGSYTNTSLTVDSKGRITAASSGAGTVPGGATTNVQFNNAGAFDGDAEFTWDTTGKELGVSGAILQDLTSANTPTVDGNLAMATVVQIETQGCFAYVTVSGSLLNIVDITQPTSPVLVSSTSIPNGPGMTLSGKYLYLTTVADTLVIVDVSDTANPVIISTTLTSTLDATFDNPQGIAISGQYAYVVNRSGTLLADNLLFVLDVSDPTTPVLVGSVQTGTVNSIGVKVRGMYAYVTSLSGISVINISDPTTPVVTDTLTTTGTTNAAPVAISGCFLYTSVGNGAPAGDVLSYDISDPTDISLADQLNVGTLTLDVYVSGSYLYVVDFTGNAVAVVDISDPTSMSLLSTVTDATNLSAPRSIYVSGRYAYVGCSNRMTTLDIHGTELTSISAGNIRTGELDVASARFDGPVSMSSGLQVNNSLAVLSDLAVNGNANISGDFVSPISSKVPVKVATSTSITLNPSPDYIDGVEVNDGDRVLVKDQAITYSTVTNPGSSALFTVVWASDYQRFIGGILNNSEGVYSDDGLTWTLTTGVLSNFMAHSPSLHTTIAGNGTASTTGFISTDGGETWGTMTYPADRNYDGVWAEEVGLFVVVGGSATVANIFSSNNGTTWSDHSSGIGFNPLRGVAWAPELPLFVAVGEGGRVFTSTNGTAWTDQGTPLSALGIINTVAWSPQVGLFVAMGDSSTHAYSSDGINWLTTVGTMTLARKVIWAEEAEAPNGSGTGIFVAVGLNNGYTYSRNAINWFSSASPIAAEEALAWSPDRYQFVFGQRSGGQDISVSGYPENGIYQENSGVLERTVDALSGASSLGVKVYVEKGDENAQSTYTGVANGNYDTNAFFKTSTITSITTPDSSTFKTESIIIKTGDFTGAAGLAGDIDITAGATVNQTAGANVNITGGTNTDNGNAGGEVNIAGGDGVTAFCRGGAVNISGGEHGPSGGPGADINITASEGTSTSAGGNLNLNPGTSGSTGTPGKVIMGGSFTQNLTTVLDRKGSVSDGTNLNNPSGRPFVEGCYAYVTGYAGDSLAVVDITIPDSPTVLAGTLIDAVDLDGPAGCYKSGQYVYVACFDGNALTVVDVSDPLSPTKVGTVSDGTNLLRATEVYVSGIYAYVFGNTFAVVDISDKTAPIVLTSFVSTVGILNANLRGNMVIRDDRAYIAGNGIATAANGGIQVIDISDPTSPSSLGDILTLGVVVGLDVYGCLAYVVNESAASTGPILVADSLGILDVSDPTSMSLVGSLQPITTVEPNNDPSDLIYSGGFVYMLDRGSFDGIYLINVRDPTAPSYVGRTGVFGSFPRKMTIQGIYLYLGETSNNSFGIIDNLGALLASADMGSVTARNIEVRSDAQFLGQITGNVGATIYGSSCIDKIATEQLVSSGGVVKHGTIDSTAGNITYTAAQVLSGCILRDTNSGRTDTLPSVTSLIAAIPGCRAGTTFDWKILVPTPNPSGNVTVNSNFTGGSHSLFTAPSFGLFPADDGEVLICTTIITNVSSGSEAATTYMTRIPEP